MKLSIAAGILSAHTILPTVVSEAKLPTSVDERQFATSSSKKKDHQSAIGSTRSFASWRRSSRGSSTMDAFTIECTPNESTEPDVGALGCGRGHICVASVDSSMGGFCMTTTAPPLTDRSLQTIDDLCYVCGETYSYIAIDNYGIEVEVPVLGNATCQDVKRSAYLLDDFDSETCSLVASAVSDACCAVNSTNSVIPYCNVCPRTFMDRRLFNQTIMSYDLTCSEIYTASYSGTGLSSYECTVLQLFAKDTCCGTSSCSICPGGVSMSRSNELVITFSNPTIEPMTCYQIFLGSYMYGTIVDETCQLIQDEARERCCLWTNTTPMGGLETSQCSVCSEGGGVAFPDVNITRSVGGENVSCSFVGEYAEKGYFDETECDYFKSIAGPCCAVPNSTGVPEDGATVAPNSPAAISVWTAGMMLLTSASFALALN